MPLCSWRNCAIFSPSDTVSQLLFPYPMKIFDGQDARWFLNTCATHSQLSIVSEKGLEKTPCLVWIRQTLPPSRGAAISAHFTAQPRNLDS